MDNASPVRRKPGPKFGHASGVYRVKGLLEKWVNDNEGRWVQLDYSEIAKVLDFHLKTVETYVKRIRASDHGLIFRAHSQNWGWRVIVCSREYFETHGEMQLISGGKSRCIRESPRGERITGLKSSVNDARVKSVILGALIGLCSVSAAVPPPVSDKVNISIVRRFTGGGRRRRRASFAGAKIYEYSYCIRDWDFLRKKSNPNQPSGKTPGGVKNQPPAGWRRKKLQKRKKQASTRRGDPWRASHSRKAYALLPRLRQAVWSAWPDLPWSQPATLKLAFAALQAGFEENSIVAAIHAGAATARQECFWNAKLSPWSVAITSAIGRLATKGRITEKARHCNPWELVGLLQQHGGKKSKHPTIALAS